MTVVLETSIRRYIGDTADAKPTGVPVGSTYLDRQTSILYVTYDGTNWVAKSTIAKLGANSGVDIGDVDILSIAAGSNLIGKVQPFAAIIEGGLTELIDKDEEVSQNDYSKSVEVALAGGPVSGEITQICVYASEIGSGAVPANSGYLFLLDADPAVASGDTALAVAEWPTVIAKVLVSDWVSDANGGMATVECGISFHPLSNLYFVFKNLGAAINDVAGDDEEMSVNFWYRRES